MTSKTTGTGMEAAELASLRRRLAEACENLSIIEEKKSLYVMEVDIPPQLIKRERRLKRKIAELEQRIAGLEAAAATAAEAAGEQAPSTAPPDPASATTPSACHRPETEDCYSRYEIGLRRLLEQLGADHPRYSEALTYQHRLIENIEQARRHGDTETLRAERSRIIEQLNRFALEEVGTPFNDLCSQASESTQPFEPTPPTSNTLALWRVFVASSGDVSKERQRLREIVEEMNEGVAYLQGIYIDLLGWQEMVVPLLGEPQQVILEQLELEDTDLLIVILWHRFDTLVGEIFDVAYNLWKKRARPQISVYHCRRAINVEEIKAGEFAELQTFLEGFKPDGHHPGLYKIYNSVDDFGKLVRRDLVRLLRAFKDSPMLRGTNEV